MARPARQRAETVKRHCRREVHHAVEFCRRFAAANLCERDRVIRPVAFMLHGVAGNIGPLGRFSVPFPYGVRRL